MKEMKMGRNPCKATFELIRRLLVEVMIDSCQKIMISGDEEHFFYDPAVKVKNSGPVTMKICRGESKEVNELREISVAGVFENGISGKFFLCFTIDKKRTDLLFSTQQFDKVVGKVIPVDDTYLLRNYYDSLFSLSLQTTGAEGKIEDLGKGRGYFYITGGCNLGSE